MTRLRTPDGIVDFYNTHFLDDDDKRRQPLKLQRQVLDLLEMVSRLSSGVPVVLTGDFNLGPDSLEVGIIKDFLGLRDPGFHGGKEVCVKHRGRGPRTAASTISSFPKVRGCTARLGRAFADRLRLGRRREVSFSDHPAGVESSLEKLSAAAPPLAPFGGARAAQGSAERSRSFGRPTVRPRAPAPASRDRRLTAAACARPRVKACGAMIRA